MVSNRIQKTPIVLGIAGGTAAGKTTISRAIMAAIGADNIAYLPHDDYYYHRPDMTQEERDFINFDHPDSLETELMVRHLQALCAGEAIERPTFDYVINLRHEAALRVEPRRIILVEGILIYSEPTLCELIDYKLFVDVPADVRVLRRLERDMDEHGFMRDRIITQYGATIRPMHHEFVEPSKEIADLIIPNSGTTMDVATKMIVGWLRHELG